MSKRIKQAENIDPDLNLDNDLEDMPLFKKTAKSIGLSKTKTTGVKKMFKKPTPARTERTSKEEYKKIKSDHKDEIAKLKHQIKKHKLMIKQAKLVYKISK